MDLPHEHLYTANQLHVRRNIVWHLMLKRDLSGI